MRTNQLCINCVILPLSVGTGWWSLIFFYNGGYSLIFVSCAASKLPVEVGFLIKHRASYLKNIKSSPTDCSHRANPYSTHGSASCSLFDVLPWIKCPGWWFHKPFFSVYRWYSCMLGKKCSLAPLKDELRKQGVSFAWTTACVCFFSSQIFTDKWVGVSPRLQVNWS